MQEFFPFTSTRIQSFAMLSHHLLFWLAPLAFAQLQFIKETDPASEEVENYDLQRLDFSSSDTNIAQLVCHDSQIGISCGVVPSANPATPQVPPPPIVQPITPPPNPRRRKSPHVLSPGNPNLPVQPAAAPDEPKKCFVSILSALLS